MQKLYGELNTIGTAHGRTEPDIARAKGVQRIGTTTVTRNADRVEMDESSGGGNPRKKGQATRHIMTLKPKGN